MLGDDCTTEAWKLHRKDRIKRQRRLHGPRARVFCGWLMHFFAAWTLPNTSMSVSAPSSSRGFCEGIRAGQMQLVDTETTVGAVA